MDQNTVQSKEGESLPPHCLILRLQLDPWKLNIGGSERNLDVALAMLRQAVTFFEEQSLFRAEDERTKQAFEEAQRSGETKRVRDILARGGGRNQ